MTSKLELDKFAITPTEEQFEKCRRDNLLLIKKALHTELLKQKVLPGATVVKGVATTASSNDLEAAEAEFESEDVARMCPVNPSPKDPLLAVRLKELEVELRRQQY